MTHTPGPHKAILNHDGRHHLVPIMATGPDFQDNEKWPHHPLLGGVYHGRGHADKKTAEATARLWAAAPDMLMALQAIALHCSSLDAEGIRAYCDAAIAKAEGRES